MLAQLSPDVFAWSESHGTSGRRYRWFSYAIRVAEKGVFALVDPLQASAREIHALAAIGPPTHVLLTCNWHLRNAEAYRSRWGCRVLVHKLGLAGSETPLDGSFQVGDQLRGAVTTIHLPGVSSWPEETALLVASGDGVLIVGDAFCGERADAGIPVGCVGKHGPSYNCAEQRRARQTARRLLTLPFDCMLFGHGEPILRNARSPLERFISNDDFFEPIPFKR